MAGLLYKDFVAVHGKQFVPGLLAVTLLLAGLCITGIDAEVVIAVQALVFFASGILFLSIPMYFENCLFSVDRGRKKKAALLSFPVSKKQYVASKYLFILLLYYVFLSVTVIWASILNAWEGCEQALVEMMALLPAFASMMLVLSAMEMPFFMVLGIQAGNMLKTTIAMILFFLVIGYGLFGDLEILDRLNLWTLVEYLREHREAALAMQTFGPVLSGVLYYLSYRIAGGIFVRKELGDEE